MPGRQHVEFNVPNPSEIMSQQERIQRHIKDYELSEATQVMNTLSPLFFLVGEILIQEIGNAVLRIQNESKSKTSTREA